MENTKESRRKGDKEGKKIPKRQNQGKRKREKNQNI